MNNLTSLVRRDIKIFYRTKGNIFFSLLSVLALVVLHFAIFRQMYTDIWEQMMGDIPGLYVERLHLQWIVDSLMFSAIIPIAAVSIALTTLGLMVADRENNTLSDFLVSPIRRNSLLASYLVSSFIVCFTMLAGLILFFKIYFFVVYGVGFTFVQAVMVLFVTIGAIVFANVFMLLLVSFFKTQQSLSAIGAITGTGIGFISGAYVPIGMFGEVVGNIFSALPFMQITVLSRIAFLYNMREVTPMTHEMLAGEVARSFGIELWLGNRNMPIWSVVLIAGGITLALLVCLMIRFAKMKKAD
ncbi:MAG: ABC transporter permease [Defluviitaleaceae bacterium]|nr:ABC transporter permease [Defluviitaleaceae bacterium]